MSPELEGRLREGIASARASWQIEVDADAFFRHAESKLSALPSYEQVRVGDLALAFACLRRDEAALAAFEEQFSPLLARTFARLKVPLETAADLGAEMRELIFFGKGTLAPLIGEYSGRGDLGAWVRAIAVRMALKVKQREVRHVDADEALTDLAADADPELGYLRQAHARAFEEALAEALATLTARQRNLLRQHYLDGLTLEALAQLYRAHRATVARWLAEARQRVLTHVRTRLAGSMTPSELDSFLRDTQRQLGLRISAVLRVSR